MAAETIERPWRQGLAELRHGSVTIVAALLGVMIGISALPYYSFGIFLSAIELEEHWPRTEIALGQTLFKEVAEHASSTVPLNLGSPQ